MVKAVSKQSSAPPQWVQDDNRLQVLKTELAVAKTVLDMATEHEDTMLDLACETESAWHDAQEKRKRAFKAYGKLLEEREAITERQRAYLEQMATATFEDEHAHSQ